MKDEFFTRGVAEVIDKESFKRKLTSGKKLRIKMGFDPTRPDLHLGHAVGMRKLRELQDAGHTIIFLVGDYTTKIGDPSGRNSTRPILSDEEIEQNAKTYLEQAGKILDVDKAEIRRNSEWFSKMSFNDILQIAGKFTVASMIERDDFEKRLKGGVDVGLHELLYPLMQAYDSVALNADVEFGGTDQKFNLLAGRDLQRKMHQEPQDIFMTSLLVGLDGKNKMSKSLDNYIGITESANEQFGKIMSIPDSLITEYFTLCTDISLSEIETYKAKIAEGNNPRDYKEKLAVRIVSIYHDEAAAKQAKEDFVKRFRDKELPDDMPEVKMSGNYPIHLLLTDLGAASSSSEARRLIEQGGVKIDGAKITDAGSVISCHKDMIVQVGKRKAYRII